MLMKSIYRESMTSVSQAPPEPMFILLHAPALCESETQYRTVKLLA